MAGINRFARDRRGASLTGYGLIVGLIAIIALGSLTSIGSQTTGLFGTVSGRMDQVVNGPSSLAADQSFVAQVGDSSGSVVGQVDTGGAGEATAFSISSVSPVEADGHFDISDSGEITVSAAGASAYASAAWARPVTLGISAEFDNGTSASSTVSITFSGTCAVDGLSASAVSALNGFQTAFSGSSTDWCNLATLDAAGAVTGPIPPEIGNLSDLTELVLTDGTLTTIPPEIGFLQNLGGLRLFNNQITAIPPEIGSLRDLSFFTIYSNQISSLPPEMGNLTELTLLFLSTNNLTSLPTEVGNWSKMQQLRLHTNNLTSLPSSISGWTSMDDLRLHRNDLTTLPAEITGLNTITQLRIFDNEMTSLPSGFCTWATAISVFDDTDAMASNADACP
ncbi:MAG: hypothetical protein Alpg2KO_11210 [Alphaproteobacteria bacterium]